MGGPDGRRATPNHEVRDVINETFPGIPDEPGTYPAFSDAASEQAYVDERDRLDAFEAAFNDYRSNARMVFSDGGFSTILDGAE